MGRGVILGQKVPFVWHACDSVLFFGGRRVVFNEEPVVVNTNQLFHRVGRLLDTLVEELAKLVLEAALYFEEFRLVALVLLDQVLYVDVARLLKLGLDFFAALMVDELWRRLLCMLGRERLWLCQKVKGAHVSHACAFVLRGAYFAVFVTEADDALIVLEKGETPRLESGVFDELRRLEHFLERIRGDKFVKLDARVV